MNRFFAVPSCGMTTRRLTQWLSFALLSTGLCTSAFASTEQQCPANNFADFVKVFSSDSTVQKTFTASSVKTTHVVAENNIPMVVVRSVKHLPADEFSMLSAENAAASNLAIEIPFLNRVVVRDQQGAFLKIFVFKHSDCWVLNSVEDWTLEAVMDDVARTDQPAPGERELKKGVMFDRLVNKASGESGVSLYAAALDSYVDGARKGSAQAAIAAAGISLSGQAPRLPNEQILELMNQAFQSNPDDGVALSLFYCDEGEYGDDKACIDPQKSMATLESAALRGSTHALLRLGEVYETGTVVAADLPRAIACYREASKTELKWSPAAVERLLARGVVMDSSIECIGAGGTQ
ncbi:SEL1-like repeat protein [Pseudomonas sp. MPR-ANC1]|uniref:SEL1-like repeat protein n=1 Tax=Pseudomonas sp. MPR-ANC1 TaxID=2075548 RepID=UPI0011AF5F01|nr:SEL1-like repeat protein [Pseudomonas sp. MPR-ANC1]